MSKKTILINVTNTMPVFNGRLNYIPGIGHAAIGLVDALSRVESIPYNICLYAQGLKALGFDFYDWKFSRKIMPLPDRFGMGRINTFLRPRLFKYDLFHITENHFPVAANERFIVTFHDCIEYQFCKENAKWKKLALRYEKMAHDSEMIVTDSNFSKEDIIRIFNVKPEKVFVNYLGIDRNRFCSMEDTDVGLVLQKFNIHNPYFFACSCNHPRKNLITALRAFKKFLTFNPQHIFVVAWGNPPQEMKEEFAKEIEDRKIIFLPFLTDEEIVALYNGASLSVYVSRKEGFGMPILESFACGTPVMTCRNSSLPEVGQDAVIYVGEDSIDEMVDVMKMFEMASYDLRQFQSKSEAVLNQFSWDNTAKRCIEVYDRCL